MRRAGLVTGLILLAAASVHAQKLPEKIGYTIFVAGKNVGRSDIKVTYGDGTIRFDSVVELKREDARFRMVSSTVVDAATFYVKSVEFEGETMTDTTRGRLEIDGTIVSSLRNAENHPTVREFESEPVLVIENFVVEHEIIIARVHTESGLKKKSYDTVFPTSGTSGAAVVETAARAAIESTLREAICEKLVITVESAGAFASYFDPGRGLPVYVAFPAVETEFFLDEFYGDEPLSRWVPRNEQ